MMPSTAPAAAPVGHGPHVGAEWRAAPPGFSAFCTSRAFDDGTKLAWREAAPRLHEVIRRRCDGEEPRAIVFAAQVHGPAIADVQPGTDGHHSIPACDGLVSRGLGAWLVIRTADCLPVVLADAQTGLFGACHAGWRGSLANILGALVQRLAEQGADPARLRGWIGPAICGDEYEVSEDLIAEFRSAWGHLGDFTRGRLLDLWELNRLQSVAAGMSQGALGHSGLCTASHRHLFHSHRRQGSLRGHQFTVCGWRHEPTG